VGLGCVLALITISTLFFHSDDDFYRKFSPVSTPLPVDTPTIDSWPYIEIIQPEDKNVWPYRVFRSSPSTPPSLNITNHGGDIADGHLFITPGNRSWELSGQHQGGPFIIGMDNELVYRHEETMACHDFRVQDIDGEPHLIYWHGRRARRRTRLRQRHHHGFNVRGVSLGDIYGDTVDGAQSFRPARLD
jgi:hypothetical protein